MPYSKKRVYKSENLKFATAGGVFHKGDRKGQLRAPTLYFRTNHGSGRLRQEHDNGPKVQDIRKHTSHAFFRTQAHVDAFHADLHSQKKAGTLTRTGFRELRRKHGGGNVPFHNAFHHEGTFKGHGGDSLSSKIHQSGGRVITGAPLEALRKNTHTIASKMLGS